MSLASIMNIAASGMNAAQTQLRVVSDNVSNVSTPGYIRKIADQESVANQGMGAGVEIARIRLATDRFLQVASLNASSESSRQAVQHEMFDSLQLLFGNPSTNGLFSKIDSLFSGLMEAANNATSGPLRQEALYQLQTVLEDSGRVSQGIQDVRATADAGLLSAVSRANDILSQIEKLNNEIAKANVSGADSTGAQTAQDVLINELSQLMDIRLTNRSVGGVEIRTGTGILLAGRGAARLSYDPAGAVNAETTFNDIKVIEPTGQEKSLAQNLQGGEIKGLLTIRDVEAPKAAERLAELTSRLVDELNRAHNAATSIPAPTSLTGRNTGMSLETALQGFTGATTVAVVNDQGVVQGQARIEFNGGNITINGVATSAAGFLADLGNALGGVTATYANGALSLTSTTGQGLAIADDAANPSSKAGRGFSHFFGLNDLIRTGDVAIYDTGLMESSTHGFTPSETISFRFADEEGTRIKDVEFTLPAGATTMGDLVNALNDPVSGIGRYGSFALSASGEMVFTGRGNPPASMTVLSDRTNQVDSGVSMSALFGLGGSRAGRSDGFSVRSDIARDVNRLALAKLDLTVPAGAAAISLNDGRGGQGLANAYQSVTSFSAAGSTGAVSMSLSRYAAELSGELGTTAASFKNRASSAALIHTEAKARRASIEGVNLDEELINLTTFQQAYNASARMIQAVSEMYDTLLGMVR